MKIAALARLMVFALPLAVPFALVWLFVGAWNDASTVQECRTAYWRAGESGGHPAGRIAERECLARRK